MPIETTAVLENANQKDLGMPTKVESCSIRYWESAIVAPSAWFDWSNRPLQPPYTQVEVETSDGKSHRGSSIAGFTLDRYSCLEQDIVKARYHYPQGDWKEIEGAYVLIAGGNAVLQEELVRKLGVRLLEDTGTFAMVIAVELDTEIQVSGLVFTTPAINAAKLTRLLGGELDRTCSEFEVSMSEFQTWTQNNLKAVPAPRI